MQLRTLATVATVLSLSVSASAVTPGRFSDPAVVAAAEHLKAKDYQGAREAALNGTDNGVRAFLVGICDEKLELFEESAVQLAYAADAFPLLADYALYHQGVSLSKVKRQEEALAPLQRVVRNHPGSRLVRPSLLLIADDLYAVGRFREALESYTAFIERYPQGSDSLNALFASALCRDKLGDPSGAVTTLRGIWICHPASGVAQKAADELARLAKSGAAVPPYTTAELYKRGNTLYDLGSFAKAAQCYAEVLERADGDLRGKVRLKMGQALVRGKRYKDAQEALLPLVQRSAAPGEASYWYARALEKSGKSEAAFVIYQALAAAANAGPLANDALLDAAYVRRFEGRYPEAVRLFQNFLNRNPESPKRPAIIWETAWSSYQGRDFKTALDYLTLLCQYRDSREKALYWLGRTLAATGDQKGAEAQLTQLRADYPFGYYALLCNKGCLPAEPPRPPVNLAAALPMPAGFEREKALIALGLHEEATRELAPRKGQKRSLGVARLYLEMGNYNGAYNLLQQELPSTGDKDSATLWGMSYPLAFRDDVSKHAGANKVPDSLVYAIMRAESNFSTSAQSPVGAVGLMQIMPATAETLLKGGSVRLATPEFNIRLGTRHLRDLLESYSGNVALAAAAYNAGGGNVKRWQKTYGGLPQDEFIESIPFRETREYVKKVTSAMALYQKMYGLTPVPPVTGPKELSAAAQP